MDRFDVVVIGGGPGGLAAAIASFDQGAKTLLLEREERLGGILKQCIHDGFGLVYFKEKLTGPEYVERFISQVIEKKIPYVTSAFVIQLKETGEGKEITYVTSQGIKSCLTKAIVLATGCRERTAKQVHIHGTRPAGVYTAGTAQHFVNLLGKMPTKRCVILGSGDIGLIMARRLTLEGAKVLGVYEAKPVPSGLTRNIIQCLEDFSIPLYLSSTVTKVFGQERVEAVEISKVDDQMIPIKGTEKIISCDGLILSVGLIPENEMAKKLGVPLDVRTKGPVCDDRFMTQVEGVFTCGNALHVNDLVDYVTESGTLAGEAAARYEKQEPCPTIFVTLGENMGYIVPQTIRLDGQQGEVIFYYRSQKEMENATLLVEGEHSILYQKKLRHVKPPSMERVVLAKEMIARESGGVIKITLKEETTD